MTDVYTSCKVLWLNKSGVLLNCWTDYRLTCCHTFNIRTRTCVIGLAGSLTVLFLSVCVCLSVCLCVCLSFRLSVCVPVCLSVCLSLCLSIFPSVCVCACLYVCQSVCLCVCLSFRLSVFVPVCLSVCLFLCLSICVCVCVCLPVFVRLHSRVARFDFLLPHNCVVCILFTKFNYISCSEFVFWRSSSVLGMFQLCVCLVGMF